MVAPEDIVQALVGSAGAPAAPSGPAAEFNDPSPEQASAMIGALTGYAPEPSPHLLDLSQQVSNRPAVEPDRSGEFYKGVHRGVAETEASGYGAVAAAGSLTGADSVKTWGLEHAHTKMIDAALHPAKIETWDDVHSLANFFDYFKSTVGESLPAIATFAAGAGVGSLAAKAAIGKAALAALTKEEAVTVMAAAAKRGSIGGMVAADYPQQVGSTYNQLKENGIDAPGTALLTALPNTAIDLANYEVMLGKAFPGLKKEMSQDLVNNLAQSYKAKFGHAFGEAAKGAAQVGATMAATMPIETLINNAARAYHDPKFDPFGPEAMAGMKEASIKAGLGGVALGAGFHGASGMNEALKARAQEILPKPGDAQPSAGVTPEDLARQVQEVGTPPPESAVVHETAPLDPNRAPDDLSDDIPEHPTVQQLAKRLANRKPQPDVAQVETSAPQQIPNAPHPDPVAEPRAKQAVKEQAAVQQEPLHPISQALVDSAAPEPAPKSPDVPEVPPRTDAPSPHIKEAAPADNRVLGKDETAAFESGDHHITIHDPAKDKDGTWSEEVRFGYGAGRPKYDHKQLDEHGNPKQAGVTKAVEFQKLKTVADRMKQIFPEIEVKIDEDKKSITYEKVMDPSGIRNPEETARGYSAFLKMLLNGEANQASKGGATLRLTHPDIVSKSKNSAGDKAKVRVSAQELTDFGAAMSGKKGSLSAIEARDSIMAAIGWMYDHGFRGTDGSFHLQHQDKGFESKPGQKGEIPAKKDWYSQEGKNQPMGDSAVVYSRGGNPWTWGYLTKALPKRIARLRTKIENLKTELSDENPVPLDKQELEVLRKRKENLERELRDLAGPESDGRIDPHDVPEEGVSAHTEINRIRIDKPTKQGGYEIEIAGVPTRLDERQPSDPMSYNPGVETDAQQAKNSSLAPNTVIHAQPKTVGDKYITTARDAKGNAAAGEAKTAVYGSEHLQAVANAAREVLDHIGLGHVAVDFISESGLEHLAKDPRYVDQIAALKDSGVAGQIIFPKGEKLSGPERRPLIYISDRVTGVMARAFVAMHELGHLVQRTHYDQATPEVKKAISDALGEHNFAENFADEFAKWAYARGEVFGKRATGKAGEFFKGMVDSLRKMWNEFRKRFDVNLTFAAYMDGLLATGLSRMGEKDHVGPTTDYGKRAEAYWKQRRRMQEQTEGQGVSAFLPENMMGPLTMNYGGEAAVKRAGKHAEDILRVAVGGARTEQTKKWLAGRANNAHSFFQLGYETLFKTTAAHVRSVPSEAFQKQFGDKFIHETSKVTTEKGGTYSQSVARHQEPMMRAIHEIAKELPQRVSWYDALRGKKEDATKVAEYKKLMQQLWHGTPRAKLSPTGQKIHDVLRQIYVRQSEMDVPLRHVSTDMPFMLNREKVRAGRDEIIRKMIADGVNQFDAEQHYQTAVENAGTFFFAKQNNGFTSSETYNTHRAIPPEVFKHLKPYVVDDVYATLMTYAHGAMRRAVAQEKFGFNAYERANRPRNEPLHNALKELDINRYSPTAKLEYNLRLMVQNGEITQTQHEQTVNKWLPAMLGRPTAKIDPTWNKVQGALMVWQNWAHMALSVFSQFNDLGAGAWRMDAPMQTLTKAIQYAFNKAKREEMLDYAKMLGFMHNSVVSHIVSDVGNGDMYGAAWAKKANDALFNLNGMHWWSQMSHAVFADIGRERLETWAKGAEKDPSMAKALEALGTDHGTVKRWLDAGAPMEHKAEVFDRDGFNGVRSALFQLVDEAVLRPDASMRPEWANNRNLAIFWQLKSWTWGFGQRFVMTAIRQGKDQEGIKKILPILALAAYTAPLSALGVMVRSTLTQSQRRDLDNPMDYILESLQQSGMFGPAQLFIDAEQAKSRGHTAIASTLGPVFSTMDDFMRNDSSYVLKNSLPASGVIKGIERWMK